MSLGLNPEIRARRKRIIIRLANEHVPIPTIAEKAGIERIDVSNFLYRARREGLVPPLTPRQRKEAGNIFAPVRVAPDILDMLKPAAIARGISVTELAKDVLIAVADGGLVDAVLDDGVASGSGR